MNRTKIRYAQSIFPCLWRSLLCGLATGLVVFLFKLAAHTAETFSRQFYALYKGSAALVLLAFGLLALAAFFMVALHKAVPEAKGGGIPRSEGVLRGRLSFRWGKTLLATIGGSLLSYLCGLPVGTEGPAVLIGTALGGMSSAKAKNKAAVERYVMSGGAGAGFAVATGAPLSAILFSLEELHKRFTPVLVISISSSVISAVMVNKLLCDAFSLSPMLLHLPAMANFELTHIGYLLGLGVFIALVVALFDRMAVRKAAPVIRHPFSTPFCKMLFVFGATGLLGLVFAEGIYSGHNTILLAAENHYALGMLLVLFVLRLFMMRLITGSGATGGIFIPTLAIGALAAAIAAKLFTLLGLPQQLFAPAVVLGMCAFIGGTLRAPLTAAVLFVELTG
ncbi:MAG: chloride channel protein, partial [Oscillospiraceae bacterium]|nr:chloride channel protein [Oscillospiraceae bacterium]